MYKDFVIETFLDQLSSSAPTPGGGAVAALNGAEAAALTQMVCNVTVNKQLKKQLPLNKELVKTVLVSSNILNQLYLTMDRDTAVFKKLMECYKMQADTPQKKEEKIQAIQQASKNACNPPMDTIKQCLKLLELIKIAVEYGDKAVISDGYIAGRLAVCALWGGIYNLKINAATITDKDFVNTLTATISETETAIQNFTDEVLNNCTL